MSLFKIIISASECSQPKELSLKFKIFIFFIVLYSITCVVFVLYLITDLHGNDYYTSITDTFKTVISNKLAIFFLHDLWLIRERY